MNIASPLIVPWIVCISIAWSAAIVQADEDAVEVDFFETRIRPVLVEHCYECHSVETDQVGGGLWLDSADGMRTGGDSGPAIVPGKVDASVLISALRYESSEMPPTGKLPDKVIEDFQRWISHGAVDPRKERNNSVKPMRGVATKSTIDVKAGRQFWAFQPIGEPSIPVIPNAGHWIDAFLHEGLLTANLMPNPPAEIDTQLRRLSFDLTGLPPSTELMDRWRNDPSDAHWRRIVDELIASPAFAEHWSRHWMDVARYADSNGSDFNATYHDAWRYRDFLIRHIAADTPVDQMIRAQIAGDLLPFDDDQQRHDNIVATTFLMLGPKMLSERDKAKLTMDVVDEQIDTVGRAFMGLTLGCARCHDHKFDPIPMEDYYALAGIFRSTLSLQGESQKYVSTWKPISLPTSQQHRDEVAEHQRAIKKLQVAMKKLAGDTNTETKAERDEQIESLKREITLLQKNAPLPLPTAMAASDLSTDQIADCRLHVRGEVSNLGHVVPRGFLQVCNSTSIDSPPLQFMGSGRLEFANWLADPKHPLTSRVAVNWIWMHLMGEGIVRTVDGFGERGERPTHPSLLDALATEFTRHDWSRQYMIRQIVCTDAYRRSSRTLAPNAAVDPENRMLWRGNRKRLDAESVRDAMLVVAGTLDRTSIDNPMNEYGVLVSDNKATSKAKVQFGLSVPHRTLYLPVIRGETPPLLATLDAADPDLLVGKRVTTNVPAQALALVGSSEVRQWAQQTANRMLDEVDNPADYVDWVYEQVLQRFPNSQDRELVADWLQSEASVAMPDDAARWGSWIAAMFASTEFRILD